MLQCLSPYVQNKDLWSDTAGPLGRAATRISSAHRLLHGAQPWGGQPPGPSTGGPRLVSALLLAWNFIPQDFLTVPLGTVREDLHSVLPSAEGKTAESLRGLPL